MKRCIWCQLDENATSFKKIAHTIPQSLGGKMTCENVCDDCNHYFGSIHDKLPAIEETIKETFNITRVRLLDEENYGANKALPRFKSKYFNVNLKLRTMKLKPAFVVKAGFQMILANQLKRGIYKIYLGELERQKGKAHESDNDFIRDYARHNIGDYPLFYYERRIGVLINRQEWIKSPQFFLDGFRMKYLIDNEYFFEFELLGHVFAIVKHPNWQEHYDNYYIESKKLKEQFFSNMIEVQFLTDIDLTLSLFDR